MAPDPPREPESPHTQTGISQLNILTILTLVATLALSCCYFTIAINPQLPINPFPPPTGPAVAVLTPIPSATNPPAPTPTPTQRFPPTWTPTPPPTDAPTPTPHPLQANHWSVEPITTSFPIEKIEVAGTYQQIGYAFGQWYREHYFMPRPLTRSERETARAMLAFYQEVHPGTVEQIRGIYVAYELDLDDVSEGIPIWKSWWTFLLPGVVERFWCSVAFARPEMTADGHALLGRNNDWASGTPEMTLLFTYPEGSYPTAIMTAGAPNFTAFDGMNNQGLGLGVASVDPAGYVPAAEPALMDLQAYRIVLETCATTEEAIDFLHTVPFAFSPQFGTHVLLADRSGESAVVEFLPAGVEVSRTRTPYQVMTNDHWAGPAGQPNCPRYQNAVALLEKGQDQMDVAGLMAVMSAVHDNTQWTIIYDLTDSTLTLTLPNDGFATHYEFSLADFVSRVEAGD
jgi:predicted choloylglycine hydrolase